MSTEEPQRVGLREIVQKATAQPAFAYSADGIDFHFEAPLGTEVYAGGYVRIHRAGADGAPDEVLLGQVLVQEIVARPGPEIGVSVDGMPELLVGQRMTSATVRPDIRNLVGGGALLGRIEAGTVVPHAERGFGDAAMVPAEPEDVAAHLAAATAGQAAIDVGRASYGGPGTRALLAATGFARHTFLCGQSGSGKTYSLGVILERLLAETDLPLVVLDPNSDFVRLRELRDSAAPGAARYAAAAAGLRVARSSLDLAGTTDALRLRFSDLDEEQQAIALRLDPVDDREEYQALRGLVETLRDERYSLEEVRGAATRHLGGGSREIALRIDNLGVGRRQSWATREDVSLAELLAAAPRGLVVDLGSLETPGERSVASLIVLARLWAGRELRRPTLIVIDEAHNVCPAVPTDPLQALATELAVLIAGEGRKFGLYLLISTQRPQKVHPNIVSQCENLLLMRMNSLGDLAALETIFSHVPGSLLRRAPHFGLGEALAAGRISPTPLLARIEGRLSREGGGDVASDWAAPRP